jgi:O-methyltransferase
MLGRGSSYLGPSGSGARRYRPRMMENVPPIPERAREIRAAGPRPGDGLRVAYLDLLKLSLCDLTGVSTRMVWRNDARSFSRELPDADQRNWRVDGSDWPLNALTMIGLRRLDDLQTCVESVVRDDIEGDLIEAGAWRGGASILMRAALDSLGASERTVHVADSFQGFPLPQDDEDNELETNMSEIDYLAPSLEDVRSYFTRFGVADGVEFVPGFFEDTLEQLRGRTWSVIRLDADGYNATRLALDVLYPGLSVGGYLIIDDYFHPHLGACRQAVNEFRAAHGIDEPIERVDWTGARWRRTEADEIVTPQHPPRPREVAVARGPRPRVDEVVRAIPTDHELELRAELERLRTRLETAERELEALQRSPLARRGPGGRRRTPT